MYHKHTQDLKQRLKYRTTESTELILTYCSELARHQESQMESESTQLGTLHLSIGYLMDSNILEVTIIQGKDFAKDLKNGSKNFVYVCMSLCIVNTKLYTHVGIYVELHLLPRWLFKESSRLTFKTNAEKHTTNPLYSKEFRM